MRELFLYTLAVAYLVVGGVAILMIIGLAGLWIRHWLIKLFPNIYKSMVRRKREKLVDKYLRSFDK
jgi:O-antigen/teichoic acid export membrane protein